MALSFLKRSARGDQLLPGEDFVGYFEPGVEIEGKLKIGSGTVRINTHLRGDIVSDGTVVVAEQGEIEASIKAKVVNVAGKVKGTIQTTERLEIKEHGVVLGDVHTRVLIVDAGGFFDGQCHMPTPEAERPTVDSIDPRVPESL
jgi:cytoskeletal protein CcmA (bactofilin family)